MTQNIEWPKNIDSSNNCKDFISKLLNKDPKKRMNASEALKHDWFKKYIGKYSITTYAQNWIVYDRSSNFKHKL